MKARAELTGGNPIDDAVLRKLRESGVKPAPICSDAVFVRRAFLDTIGITPRGYEARQFILDRSPGKRKALIESLLKRDEFAEYWTMKWCDLLRVKAEFPINLWPNAAQSYYRWIRAAVRENRPYDLFARELLTASGSNFRDPPVNFYRAMQSRDPQSIARTVALTFMGCRAEKWSTNQLANMGVFFSQVGYKSTAEWKEEIVFFDPWRSSNSLALEATFPDGTTAALSSERDPREVFAGWLVQPDNRWFTASIANRIWFWLLGRGVVQEPDDFRADNPPSNPELLKVLERELIADHYDLKQSFRVILNSGTYQLSSLHSEEDARSAALFASYPMRRLEAEVLIDAINQITVAKDSYSSAIPEPFTFIPPGTRSVSLPDGSIGSAYLEMFGRPPRDTGLESERNNHIAADQRLFLLNSSVMENKLEQCRLTQSLAQSNQPTNEVIVALYMELLSRFPSRAELELSGKYFQTAGTSRKQAIQDLTWSLMNSAEFLHRH